MNAQSDEGERERGGGVMDANPSLLLTKKKRLKLLVAQGFREIDRRFITAPSLLTIWVLSISLMQIKPHLKNKHNMDLAMPSPSIHLGLYRYKFIIRCNKNTAILHRSSSTLQRVWKYWRHSVKRPARGLILGGSEQLTSGTFDSGGDNVKQHNLNSAISISAATT